jgi:hypothetical protein
MKFNPAKCPICSGHPDRIIESVYVMTGLAEPDANGETDFDSELLTKVLWDSAEPDRIRGKVTLFCGESHEWQAKMTREEWVAPEVPQSKR